MHIRTLVFFFIIISSTCLSSIITEDSKYFYVKNISSQSEVNSNGEAPQDSSIIYKELKMQGFLDLMHYMKKLDVNYSFSSIDAAVDSFSILPAEGDDAVKMNIIFDKNIIMAIINNNQESQDLLGYNAIFVKVPTLTTEQMQLMKLLSNTNLEYRFISLDKKYLVLKVEKINKDSFINVAKNRSVKLEISSDGSYIVS